MHASKRSALSSAEMKGLDELEVRAPWMLQRPAGACLHNNLVNARALKKALIAECIIVPVTAA